jgi:ERCC4-type nuclease
MTEDGNKNGIVGHGSEAASPPSGQAEAFSCVEFLMAVPGVGRTMAENVIAKGYSTKDDLVRLTNEDLVQVPGVSGPMAERILAKISKDLPRTDSAAPAEGKGGPVVFKIKDETKSKDGELCPSGEGKTEVSGVTIEPCPQTDGEGAKPEAKSADKKEKKPEDAPKSQDKKEPGFFQRLIAPLSNIFKKKPIEAPAKKEDEIKVEVQDKGTTVIELKGEDFTSIPGVTPQIATQLRQAGYQNVSELKEAITEDLVMIEGIDEATAKAIIAALHPE